MNQITDPQSQSAYPQADPNTNAVENTQLDGGTDNQRILARQTSSGVSRGVQQLGGPSLQADSGNKQITVTDLVPQVLMGNQPTFGEGLYVTKPGIDVTSPHTTADDFVFNSNQDVFKIVKSGSLNLVSSVTANPGAGLFASSNATIALERHSLGYKPAVLAYMEFTNGVRVEMPYTAYDAFSTSSAGWGSYIPFVTETFVGINLRQMVYGTGLNSFSGAVAKYFLLQESAD